MPVELQLRAEGDNQQTIIRIEGRSEDFDFESNGQPIEVVVDPNNKILRMSDDLRVSIIARRGIEQMKEGIYAEAQQQFEAALKLDRSNSWVYYNLGLLFLEQRNWQQALDNLEASLIGNLKPSWIEAWAHIKRGNAYDAKGERQRAVLEYNKAVASGIDYDNAQAVAKRYLATPYDPKAEANLEATRQANLGMFDSGISDFRLPIPGVSEMEAAADNRQSDRSRINSHYTATIAIFFLSAAAIISSRSNIKVLPAVMHKHVAPASTIASIVGTPTTGTSKRIS